MTRVSRRRIDVLALEDALLGLAELRAGFQTELVEQVTPRRAVDGERVRLPAAAVQRRHQERLEPLAQRIAARQVAELGDRLDVTAALQLGGVQLLERHLTALGQ